jgi:HEAT repeat protein
VIEWMAIAGAVGKAVASPITKEIFAAGKAKVFPGEVEKAVAAGIKAALEEDEQLSQTQHLFYRCDDKNVRDFLGKGMILPATVLELRKPLEQKGTPDIDCLVRVFVETAKELKLELENENLRRWIKTFAEVYFQKTSAITAFLVARERYLAALVKSCDDIKFVGIDAAVREVDRSANLLDIFVVPNVFAEVDRSNDREREKLTRLAEDDDLLLEQRQRLAIDRSAAPMLADRLLHGQQRLVLLGDPGSGKTTLMRYLAVKLAQGHHADLGLTNHDDWLPMLIYMRDWAKNPERSLFEQLADFAKSTLHVDLPTGFFQYWWQGRSLVLLDGLDEVVDEAIRADLVNKLGCVLDGAEQNAVVITSRPWGYHRAYFRTENFPHFELLPFDQQQIKQFVENWYRSRHDNAQDAQLMIDNLQESLVASDRVQQLVTNPLLLTIVALIHRYQDELPKRRYQLYDKAVNTLLKSWDRTEKGLGAEQKDIFKCLDREDDLRRVLSLLAKWIHEQYVTKPQAGGTLIQEQEFIDQLRVIILDEKEVKPHKAIEEAKRFKDFVRDRTGLINEYGQGWYGFVHKTFQEYLTAEAIQSNTIDNDDLAGMLLFIKNHLHQQHWREVILLLVSQQQERRAATIIETILRAGSDYEQWLHRDLLLAAECLTEDPKRLKKAGRVLGQEILAKLVNLVVSSDRVVGSRVQQKAKKLLCRLRNTEFQAEAMAEIEKWQDRIDRFELLEYRFYLGQQADTISELLVLLTDRERSVRYQATEALRRLGNSSETVLKALIPLLTDPEELVRHHAAVALGRLGNSSDTVLNALIPLLTDPKRSVRSHAAVALGRLGNSSDTVLNALIPLLTDREGSVRYQAAVALGRLGNSSETVLNALILLLTDSKDSFRFQAAETLGRLGNSLETVLNALILLLTDPERSVRYQAAEVLGQLGNSSETVLNALILLLTDPKWLARYQAAEVLGQLGNSSDTVLNALIPLLTDSEALVRYQAAAALGQLGNSSDTVLNALIPLLIDPEDSVRIRAAEALGRLGNSSETVLNALIPLLIDPEDSVRIRAAEALGQLGNSSETVLNTLIPLLSDSEYSVRYQAAEALGKLGQIDPTAVVQKILLHINNQQSPDAEIGNAIDALWQIIEG